MHHHVLRSERCNSFHSVRGRLCGQTLPNDYDPAVQQEPPGVVLLKPWLQALMVELNEVWSQQLESLPFVNTVSHLIGQQGVVRATNAFSQKSGHRVLEIPSKLSDFLVYQSRALERAPSVSSLVLRPALVRVLKQRLHIDEFRNSQGLEQVNVVTEAKGRQSVNFLRFPISTNELVRGLRIMNIAARHLVRRLLLQSVNAWTDYLLSFDSFVSSDGKDASIGAGDSIDASSAQAPSCSRRPLLRLELQIFGLDGKGRDVRGNDDSSSVRGAAIALRSSFKKEGRGLKSVASHRRNRSVEETLPFNVAPPASTTSSTTHAALDSDCTVGVGGWVGSAHIRCVPDLPEVCTTTISYTSSFLTFYETSASLCCTV